MSLFLQQLNKYPLIFLVLISLSCNKSTTKKYLIGFSQCIGSDAWRKQMLNEMNLELEFHPEITMLYRDANAINETQVKQIEELLQAGIDLLIVSPNESEPLTAVVNKAYNKGIPVILIDRKTNSENYTTFIGANNYEIGRTAGQEAVMLLREKGRIIEIFGLKGSSPAQERHQGFVDEIKKYKNMVIIKQVFGKWLMEKALEELKINITSADSVDLVYAHNDVMAFAAHLFFDSIGTNDLKIIGVDGLAGEGNGIDMVDKKLLSATILYPTGGEEAIRLSAKVLHGDTVPKMVTLNSTVIDENNSHIMEQQAKKLLSQRQTIEQQQEHIVEQLKIYSNQRAIVYILTFSLIILSILLIRVFKSYKVINAQKGIIEKQNKHLETLNKTKNKFFSVVAHDFKSPLFSLHAMSDLIIRDYNILKEKEMISAMQDLNKSVESTIKMADNLITWARVQMNDFQFKVEVFPILDIVSDILNVYNVLAINKGITINSSIENSLQVKGDKNQIKFIIRNLLNNAIKFTNNGGLIEIVGKTLHDGDVQITVSDNGVGISEEMKNSLFTLGTNQNTIGTAGEKGTGLGLMLSYEFIKLNQGQIRLESTVGRGTTFYVKLKSGYKRTI